MKDGVEIDGFDAAAEDSLQGFNQILDPLRLKKDLDA